MANDKWDQLEIHFGQTFETRLRTLQLKCIQYKMDSSWIMAEHLRTMDGIICNLKAVGKDVYEGEQVLNVIWALLDKLKDWSKDGLNSH